MATTDCTRSGHLTQRLTLADIDMMLASSRRGGGSDLSPGRYAWELEKLSQLVVRESVYDPERRVDIRGCMPQGVPWARVAVRVEHVVQRSGRSGEVGGRLYICRIHFLFPPPLIFFLLIL